MDSLRRMLGGMEQRPEWRSRQQFQQLLSRWVGVVGPAVALQTRPTSIRRGVLYVATSNPVWAQNLMFERQRILAKLNACLPFALNEVRFSTAEWHNPSRLPSVELDSEQVWQQHPSRLKERSSPPHPSDSGDRQAEGGDAQTTFQRWAEQVQERSRHLPLCPECRCATPPGELERWSVCGLCATKRWQ